MHWVGLFAAFCIAAPVVTAQSAVEAAIPFAFTVRDTQYPAGTWVIERNRSNSQLQLLRSTNSKHQFMVMSIRIDASTAPGPARLIFNRYGGEYFLSEIWRDGGDGARLLAGSAERELVATGSRSQTVALVLSGTK